MPRILDVGCGNNKAKGALGIDVNPDTKADVLHDLNQFPYPFKDNEFDIIICKQILEHLDNVGMFLEELYRISKKGAKVLIEVPHFSCYCAFGDPEHKRSFSHFSADFLTRKGKFKVVKDEITFHKSFRKYKLHRLFNKFPRAYERFWTFIIPAEHLHFELEVVK